MTTLAAGSVFAAEPPAALGVTAPKDGPTVKIHTHHRAVPLVHKVAHPIKVSAVKPAPQAESMPGAVSAPAPMPKK
jgi:sorbitol-specific phosphotransferase system component IIBC